jgi:hypothetical protein
MPTGSQQLPDLNTLVADLLAGRLTEAQAAAIAALGPEAVTLALMAASAKLAGVTPDALPSTPSGMIPPYQKPPADKKRRKKSGAVPGHKGSRRKTPVVIDQKVEHRLDGCPCCGRTQRGHSPFSGELKGGELKGDKNSKGTLTFVRGAVVKR